MKTGQALSEAVAVEIMGWKKHKDDGEWWWGSTDDPWVIRAESDDDDWFDPEFTFAPHEDRNQSRQVADKGLAVITEILGGVEQAEELIGSCWIEKLCQLPNAFEMMFVTAESETQVMLMAVRKAREDSNV